MIDIYAPRDPWPEEFTPLTAEEAVKALSDGDYPGSDDTPASIDRDVKLADQVREFKLTAARTPEHRIAFQPTVLANMQMYN